MEFSFVAQDPNLYLSNEEKTLRIIHYIQSLRISFRDFLVVAFLSDDTTIEAYVNKFYGNDGPQAITKCWDRLFYGHKRGYNGSFQAAIIDAVIRRSKRDLRRITKAGAFRCPSNKVTRDYFDTFSLRTIESELERYAPCLTKVLRGLQGSRLSHQGVFVPVMGAMVCYNHSNKSNTLQLKMALSLYTVGCPKRAMNSLNALGLTASYTTVYKALRALTQDRMRTIQQLAQTMPIIILSDNLNWIDGVHHQLLNNPSIVRNTTTVTIVIGKELGDDLHGPVEQPHIRHLLTGGNDNNHSEEGDDGNEDAFCPVARFYLFDVLQKSHEPYRMFVTAFKIPDGTLLGSTPTLAFEIGLLDIDQSTVSGNIQVIEHVQELLDLPQEFFETRKLGLVGDLLTISRFHSAKQRRASEIDSLPSDRWEWAVPIFGLFHLQMTVVKVILRTHYGSHDTPGSLAYNISLLGRKRIDRT